MKHFSRMILFLTSLAFAGCTLEEPFEGVYCPEDFSTQLSYINFYGVTCSAADCLSADQCCDIVEKTLSKTIWESFKYSRCPANSNFPKCSNDGAEYFCSSGCMFGYEMCKGSCVDFDAGHITSCVGAELVCENGWIDCDGKISNGCELSTTTHIQSCKDPETPVCMDGWADCDGKMGNGCEVNLFGDSQNCGACDNVCTENPICSHGVCSEACERGTANCGGQCLNLPVLNIQSCLPDSNELTCMRNYMDCDGELANGCEVNIQVSNTDCGKCGDSCGAGQVCLDGRCEVDICADMTETPNSCIVDGNNVCRNIHSDDAMHCGACNYKCSEHPIPNAVSETCIGGNCQYICATGYVNVGNGNTAQTINCIDPNTDNTYCGAESSSNPGETCTGGKVCVEKSCVTNSCTDVSAPNLCVVNGLNSCRNINANDADHCGACNYKCSEHGVQNATSDRCSDGDCQYTCTSGYVNVGSGNTSQSIKCIDPKSDNSYCGAKSAEIQGQSCTGGKVCVDSQCVTNSCTDPSKPNLCVVSGQNTCQNINSDDANHCGACNYKCSDHAIPNATSSTCSGGNCQYTCTSGYVNVGTGITANTILCIDPKTNNTYCSATGNASGAASSSQKGTSCTGGTVCVDGSCQTNSCTDSSKPNLCVVNGQNTCQNINSNDANHCGACNYKCSDHAIPNATSNSCSGGNCQYTCTGGYVNVGTGITANTILCIDPKTNNSYCNATGNASGAASSSQKGTACTGGTVCVDGRCQTNSCTDSSKPNLCVVNGQNTCQNINSNDANHCGACNYKCSEHAIPNATSSKCSGGNCQYTCTSGYVNVGTGITSNTILCIDPKTNNTYCNATGNASGAASSSQKGTSCTGGTVCVDASCQTNSCTESSKPNLCVVNGQNTCQNINSTDVNHCGSCNYKCAVHAIPNATSNKCSDGNCQYTCANGYVNVGTGITANTILCIDPKTNNTYCNATGNASGAASSSQKGTSCTGGSVCVNGTCLTNSCTDSGKPNLCVVGEQNVCLNINSDDANHCGACNFRCAEHSIQGASSDKCTAGECQYTCNSGYVNVGTGITANTILCIDPQTNSMYCGATGNPSGAANNNQIGKACGSGAGCISGVCEQKQMSCSNSSETLCAVSSGYNCINLNSNNADHCGACNYKCAAHPILNATSSSCSGGSCNYTCTAGYVNVGSGIKANTIHCVDPNSDPLYCGAIGNNSGGASPYQIGTQCDSLTQICAASHCQQRPELALLLDSTKEDPVCWYPDEVCEEVAIHNHYCTVPPYHAFNFFSGGMANLKTGQYEVYAYSDKMFFNNGAGYIETGVEGNVTEIINELPSYSCPKDYHNYHEGGEVSYGDNCGNVRIICVYSQKADKFFKIVVFWYYEAKFMYWMPDILE